MSARPNYARFPGMGDLPGDSTNPNSPDYVDPAYGKDDAECDVAAQLVEADEVGALVADVRGSLGFLRWAAGQDIPTHLLAGFRALDRQARQLDRAVDDRINADRRAA